MLHAISTAFFSLLFFFVSNANDYEDAWTAINKKNFKEAKSLLQKAIKDPATSLDSHLTLLFLQTYQGDEENIVGLFDKFSQGGETNPYIYALWLNGAVLGEYGKKNANQLALINKIIASPVFNGSLQAAAHYVKSMHYVFSNEFSKAKEEHRLMGAIEDWQLAGPFENLSGSAFNTQYGPLTMATQNSKFKGLNNIELTWFKPKTLNKEGWISTYSHLRQNSAIVYAQTFIYSPEEQKVLLNGGVNGSLKIWVNDALILSESKERVTELDYYKNSCTLKKGFNRLLVQLGYTDNSIPNFIVRFTDNNFNPIENLSSTSEFQSYAKSPENGNTTSIKHFAEDFFEKKIASQPKNLLNYLLLSQAFLRNDRITEARNVIEKALVFSPDNALLKFELAQCLSKAGNRTLLSQELDWLKENDPDSYLNFQIKIQNLINEEKYVDADDQLIKMTELYGEDENILQLRATVLGKLERVDDLLKLVDKAFKKYPENVSFVSMMFRIKKLVDKDLKGATNVYERFLKSSYNYEVLSSLADEYKEQGLHDKYLGILKELYNQSDYDPIFPLALSTYYYESQNYIKSLEYAKEALQLAPFTGKYWYNVAVIQEQMNTKTDAILSYKKAIYYDRTNYDARKKLNALENKPDLYKVLPDSDVYSIVKNTTNTENYDYSYVLDEKGTIIYDEGASEEYITYAAKIYTQKGIESWKEIYLSYSPGIQTLLVEKCEVIKANGSKVAAERDEDHVVFTGLTPGDAIYVKYRLQNYSSGRLGKEFWDKFTFNSFVPSREARYTLIVPNTYKFNYQVANSKVEPSIKDVEDFKVYTWDIKNVPAIKSEPLMPVLNDVGTVLHISTLKTWSDVADWYSDISYQDVTDNFELTALYNEIFPDKKQLTDSEKAKRIYNFIVKNISYSSVSFRQSGLVPQNVSKTISTKLGDCKDLSTLFVALANKAGIDANLVLIDTRDNGLKDMILPSMEFNHCIALLKMDNKEYYIELTDSNLPFGSLPTNLNGALSLIIPSHGNKSNSSIKPLSAVNRTTDKLVRQIEVVVKGKDEIINVVSKRYGAIVSAWRADYATLSADKQKENYEQSISNGYNNSVKLESLSFAGLNDLGDSLITNYTYTVKNEVVEAGSMKMIKLPLIDIIATLESLSADKREFPIEYWNYENTDQYETTVTIQLAAGQKILEVPENQTMSYKKSSYTIKYIKVGDKLKIFRTVKLQREDISASDYDQFKKFFNDIVEAESKYIVFK